MYILLKPTHVVDGLVSVSQAHPHIDSALLLELEPLCTNSVGETADENAVEGPHLPTAEAAVVSMSCGAALLPVADVLKSPSWPTQQLSPLVKPVLQLQPPLFASTESHELLEFQKIPSYHSAENSLHPQPIAWPEGCMQEIQMGSVNRGSHGLTSNFDKASHPGVAGAPANAKDFFFYRLVQCFWPNGSMRHLQRWITCLLTPWHIVSTLYNRMPRCFVWRH